MTSFGYHTCRLNAHKGKAFMSTLYQIGCSNYSYQLNAKKGELPSQEKRVNKNSACIQLLPCGSCCNGILSCLVPGSLSFALAGFSRGSTFRYVSHKVAKNTKPF